MTKRRVVGSAESAWGREGSSHNPSRGQRRWRNLFLEAFRNSGNVRAACRSAGISRSAAYLARETDRAFREQWDEAREDAIDTLEAVAWQRARDSSDYLLWKLLQSNRRSLYSDKVAVGGDEGGPVLVRVVYDDPDLYKLDTPTRARDEWQSGIASHGDEAPELELIDGNAGEASCSGRQQYQPTR